MEVGVWPGSQVPDGSLPPAPWQVRFWLPGSHQTGTGDSEPVREGPEHFRPGTGTAHGSPDSPSPEKGSSWRAAKGPGRVASCPLVTFREMLVLKSWAEAQTSLHT